jgi:predicted dienelactone hydrolase
MRPLEIVFLLVALGFLIAQTTRGAKRSYLFALAVAGLSTILASGLLWQVRWQLAPAYIVFAVLSLLLLKRSSSHLAVRLTGALVGTLLLTSSALASLAMPILTLPVPNGPHVVGASSFSLIDAKRDNSFFGRPNEPRELFVQLWYPGAVTDETRTAPIRALWKELYRGDLDLFTVFARYLRGIETHSYEDIPLSPEQLYYPAIIFSHAMVSFAEQNTLLMEHLASHGYMVFAISHPYTSMRVVSSSGRAIYPDFDKVNEVSAQFRPVNNDLTPKIARAGSTDERTRLQLDLYERASGNNALMAIWVDDLRFVLDRIAAESVADPRWRTLADHVDAERIGFLGMSFGGGAVTELCKSDTRCRATLNMDGPTFGQRQRQPLEVPYLALVRENQNTLDYLRAASRSDYYQVEVKGTTHLDFTDDTVVIPVLKWLGVTGHIDGWRAIDIANAVSLRFFDAYLRGGPRPRFEDFPELMVQTRVGE